MTPAHPFASRPGRAAFALLVALVGTTLGLTGGGGSATGIAAAPSPRPVVLAYYYAWYSPSSWSRAKSDLPQLGAYSSADPAVIAQHVAWAKAAGIDAFIVSWKHQRRLDKPLATLVEEARRAGLGLVLLYEGLDFARDPLSAQLVSDDLVWFMEAYRNDPVFGVFGRPTIIVSGTPSFTDDELKVIRAAVLGVGPAWILGSERSGIAYEGRRDLLDGDAYYWSSVDPTRDRFYRDRLDALAKSIRADDGLWIAPVAPGFDARLVGGTRVVERANGETLQTEWETAVATNPDGIGIISWNEFSENSHIEPSRDLGSTYITMTARLVEETFGRHVAVDPPAATPVPTVVVEPSPNRLPRPSMTSDLIARAAIAVVLIVGLLAVARRPRQRSSAEQPRP